MAFLTVMNLTEHEEVYAGQWQDEEQNVLNIEGSVISGPGGLQMELAAESSSSCVMCMEGEFFEGKLNSDRNELHWSDGAVWTRKGSLPAKASKKALGNEKLRVEPKQRKRKTLSLEQTLSLQLDLLQGFEKEEFQIELEELEKRYQRGSKQFLEARAQLFLTVQSVVLPKYGFEGTEKGVLDMLTAAARWNHNERFLKNRENLNELLGLTEPQKKQEGQASQTVLQQQTRSGPAIALAVDSALGTRPSQLRPVMAEEPAVLRTSAVPGMMPVPAPFGSAVHSVQRVPMRFPEDETEKDCIDVTVREALGTQEVQIVVPEKATFSQLKAALAHRTGVPDVLKKGHFIRPGDDTCQPYMNAARIGEVREVLLLGVRLKLGDDG